MVVMLPVRAREHFTSSRTASSTRLRQLFTAQLSREYDPNPVTRDNIYTIDLGAAGIEGVRETAFQIIKDRLNVSRSLQRS